MTGVVKNTLKVNQYFDQGCKMEVRPITPLEIKGMRQLWMDKYRREPSRDVQYTDNQLSVLCRLSEAGHNMLAFDMGSGDPMASYGNATSA